MMTKIPFDIDGIRVRPPVEETPEDIREQIEYGNAVIMWSLLFLAAGWIVIHALGIAHADTVSFVREAPAIAPVTRPHESPRAPHEFRAEVSAYTSSPDETDDTPDVNAAGTKPGPGSIACPSRFPLGTKVSISGDEFTCDDRMGSRYAEGDYFDIWRESKQEAFAWGRRHVTVRILD